MTQRELVCRSGRVVARIGDRFSDHQGEWEIVAFMPDRAGDQIVVIKPVGMSMPSCFDRYVHKDGTVDFCGDSVAAALLTKIDGKKRDARGGPLLDRKT